MIQVYVNYVAVVAAAIVNMVLGFVWYGPLFGKQWVALMGWSKEKIEAGNKKMKQEGWKTYLLAFAGSLVMAGVLRYSLVFASSYMHASGLYAGVMTGFWMWFGFVAPVTLGAVLWEGKPWKWWVLMNGYYLVALVVTASLLSLWV